MAVNRADNAVRLAVSDILSNFLCEYEWDDGPLATLRDEMYRIYRPGYVNPQGLHKLLNRNPDIGMRNEHLFLFLEPIEDKNILPLLTLESSSEWIHFRIYVLLTMLDECAALQAMAIRFETDEGVPQPDGTPGSHDFCHAQLCRCINGNTLATTPSWIPESQPSIPLDADDQVGLVLCMLTSLYGARHVLKRLDRARDRDLREHAKKVRAFGLNRPQE